eukprot:TRINITY_DN1964_c0_g1_i1.p1 TRINITY_DN1964_c0_g1~~TRINITY_DN1964_c0_g1_i1.p1  ORF type:complete len:253 (+),score=50.83 TRINITY_DN1964_c0_g1_i1:129-887(+)
MKPASREKCVRCSKTVYALERLEMEGKIFHKACFRCAHCDSVIKAGNCAALDSKFYCKPHFKQLFALKGNYNEGFGTEKLVTKWMQSPPGSPSVPPTSSRSATSSSSSVTSPSSSSPASSSHHHEALPAVPTKEPDASPDLVASPTSEAYKEADDNDDDDRPQEEGKDDVGGLSQDQINAAEAFFQKYDRDGNGIIDRDEFLELLRDFRQGRTTTDADLRTEADRHFNGADKDSSGGIDETEFLEIYSKLLK